MMYMYTKFQFQIHTTLLGNEEDTKIKIERILEGLAYLGRISLHYKLSCGSAHFSLSCNVGGSTHHHWSALGADTCERVEVALIVAGSVFAWGPPAVDRAG